MVILLDFPVEFCSVRSSPAYSWALNVWNRPNIHADFTWFSSKILQCQIRPLFMRAECLKSSKKLWWCYLVFQPNFAVSDPPPPLFMGAECLKPSKKPWWFYLIFQSNFAVSDPPPPSSWALNVWNRPAFLSSEIFFLHFSEFWVIKWKSYMNCLISSKSFGKTLYNWSIFQKI